MQLLGEGGGRINWEIGIDIYTLLYIKQITNKDLLYSTGNSTQYSEMARENRVSLVTQMPKNLPVMQETQVSSLGWEDPLENRVATHSMENSMDRRA